VIFIALLRAFPSDFFLLLLLEKFYSSKDSAFLRFFVGFDETVPGTANPVNSQLQLSQSK
jgi:hypothetical protein